MLLTTTVFSPSAYTYKPVTIGRSFGQYILTRPALTPVPPGAPYHLACSPHPSGMPSACFGLSSVEFGPYTVAHSGRIESTSSYEIMPMPARNRPPSQRALKVPPPGPPIGGSVWPV